MPNLPQSFSAYPASVVLDGSGNGSIGFQATGSNIRITNISVRVSSANAQATATLYKGQIGEPYRLSGTNSGSTGDTLASSTDLFDGETVYIAWTGGDPGAIATATFSGNAIPKGDVGNATGGGTWSNPVAAGDGSLIYPSIKSPNFVTNVSGWQISRDGRAEFYQLIVREGALRVRNANTGAETLVGSERIEQYPATTSNLTTTFSEFRTAVIDNASVGYAYLSIQSPGVNGLQAAQVVLFSTSLDGINRHVSIGGDLWLNGNVLNNGIDQGRGFHFSDGSATTSPAVTTVEGTVLTTGTTDFFAGRLYRIDLTGRINQDVNGAGPVIRIKKNSGATTFITVGRMPITGNVEYAMPGSLYFRVGASDVTSDITVTMAASNGNATWVGPRSLSVWDCGLASTMPFVPLI